MRLPSVAAAAAITGFVCPAYAGVVVAVVVHSGAETPAPRVPVLDHSLTLEVAGDSTRVSDVALPLAIAPGMHVTAMTVTIAGRRTEAVRAAPWSAASDFGWSVRREIDPALLEQTAPGMLQLRVFPVTKDQHAFVELTVEAEDPNDWMHAAPHPGVDDRISLVAIEAPVVPRGPVPTAVIDGPGYHYEVRSIDKKIIRRYVKLAEPRLANCWQHELFHAPTLQGTAELHFAILPDGTIGGVSVDGSLDSDAAKRCMAEDIATWRFPQADGTTRVNYPLTFKVAE